MTSRTRSEEQGESRSHSDGKLKPYLKSLRKILKEKGEKKSSIILFVLEWLNANTNIDVKGLREIFKGAYTVIDGDIGGLYYETCKMTQKINNSEAASIFVGFPHSSHASCPQRKHPICTIPGHKNQMRLGQGTLFDCERSGACDARNKSVFFDLLMGITCDSKQAGNTWFQFEYARITGVNWSEKFVNKYIKHLRAFLLYKGSGKNQGMFGSSLYKERGMHYILTLKKNNVFNITSSFDPRNSRLPLKKLGLFSRLLRRKRAVSDEQSPAPPDGARVSARI